MSIDNSEITFVIQGALDQLTQKCIESINQYYKGSKIILSTWEGSNVDDFNVDEILLNKDPGNFMIHDNGVKNNVNRQIVSTLEGLKKVKTKYAVKIRSDCYLNKANLIELRDKYALINRKGKFALLKERVLICSMGCRDFRVSYIYPFHYSDFFFFGLTEDLLKIWDIPLAKQDEQEFFYSKNHYHFYKIAQLCDSKYVPEQHIIGSFVRKYYYKPFFFTHSYDLRNAKLSDRILVNNFIIHDNFTIGFRFEKYDFRYNKKLSRLYLSHYNHFDWLCMYYKQIKHPAFLFFYFFTLLRRFLYCIKAPRKTLFTFFYRFLYE